MTSIKPQPVFDPVQLARQLSDGASTLIDPAVLPDVERRISALAQMRRTAAPSATLRAEAESIGSLMGHRAGGNSLLIVSTEAIRTIANYDDAEGWQWGELLDAARSFYDNGVLLTGDLADAAGSSSAQHLHAQQSRQGVAEALSSWAATGGKLVAPPTNQVWKKAYDALTVLRQPHEFVPLVAAQRFDEIKDLADKAEALNEAWIHDDFDDVSHSDADQSPSAEALYKTRYGRPFIELCEQVKAVCREIDALTSPRSKGMHVLLPKVSGRIGELPDDPRVQNPTLSRDIPTQIDRFRDAVTEVAMVIGDWKSIGYLVDASKMSLDSTVDAALRQRVDDASMSVFVHTAFGQAQGFDGRSR